MNGRIGFIAAFLAGWVLIPGGIPCAQEGPQAQPQPQAVLPGKERIRQLGEVLHAAYEGNPALLAARAALRATEEKLPQALSGWQPTADASAGVTAADIDGAGAGSDGTTSKEIGVSVSQPLYRGGRTMAETAAARERIKAQKALLTAAEQDMMLAVARAYMDVVRDTALLDLGIGNENVVTRELEATQQRFDVGELTRTDVAQAQARVAKAQAERVRAEGNLQASRAVYEQVVGEPPAMLVEPVLRFPFPETLEEAVALAEESNPSAQAALYLHEAAKNDADTIFGELLPEIALFGTWDRAFDPQPGLLDETTTGTVGVSASIPLYEAGKVRSRVREAKHTASQRYLENLAARRDVRKQVVTQWENLQAAKAEIAAREAQVKAARLAQKGVREENALGARSVLDALDADQEYLDSRTSLVSARRNEIVAAFSLAATLAFLTPESFGPPVLTAGSQREEEDDKLENLPNNVDSDTQAP